MAHISMQTVRTAQQAAADLGITVENLYISKDYYEKVRKRSGVEDIHLDLLVNEIEALPVCIRSKLFLMGKVMVWLEANSVKVNTNN